MMRHGHGGQREEQPRGVAVKSPAPKGADNGGRQSRQHAGRVNRQAMSSGAAAMIQDSDRRRRARGRESSNRPGEVHLQMLPPMKLQAMSHRLRLVGLDHRLAMPDLMQVLNHLLADAGSKGL